MSKPTALLLAFLLLSLLVGCDAGRPPAAAPVSSPKATTSRPLINDNSDPDHRDCAAIKDAAEAENCRLWKGIEAAKKRHNSDPAVKHNPGSIQQP